MSNSLTEIPPFNGMPADGRHIMDIDAEVRKRVEQTRETYANASVSPSQVPTVLERLTVTDAKDFAGRRVQSQNGGALLFESGPSRSIIH
jgi:hypothetical protein